MSKPYARKRFGQHFLVDEHVIAQIIALIAPRHGEHIFEIGPGRCALTTPLVESGADLAVLEIDRDLAPAIAQQFRARSNFQIHVGDALHFDFDALANAGKYRVVGNLPYNISTPLILRLLTQSSRITDMTFMLQKEVVQRLAANPHNKHYGRLSVMVQSQCAVEAHFDVLPDAFAPPPRVDSKLVRILPHATELPDAVRNALSECVRVAFSQRRKTLKNTLGKRFDMAILEATEIDLSKRAEDIDVPTYRRLAESLADA